MDTEATTFPILHPQINSLLPPFRLLSSPCIHIPNWGIVGDCCFSVSLVLHERQCALLSSDSHSNVFTLTSLAMWKYVPRDWNHFSSSIHPLFSRDSSVGIATDYGLDGRGSIPCSGKRFIYYVTASRPALRPNQPPIQWVLGSLSAGIKRQGREADHSSPSIADVKNALSHTFSWCGA
jgi:hypothetical protein